MGEPRDAYYRRLLFRRVAQELDSLTSAISWGQVTGPYAASELRALANRLDPQTTPGSEEVQPEGGEA